MRRFIDPGKVFDLVVIGGGITGVCVTRAVARLGYSVALLEQGDFGGGTSAKTSKMIHGGLRYLKNLELGLVRESLAGRHDFLRLAPDLVRPLPLMLAVYRDRLFTKAGLALYDRLAGSPANLPAHSWISRDQTIRRIPIIEPQGLKGSYIYYDCQSPCPERLTLSILKTVINRHTGPGQNDAVQAANYIRTEGFCRMNNRITGVWAIDLMSGRPMIAKAKLVVNCSGPWANEIIDLAHCSASERKIRWSEGVHIIVPKLYSGDYALVLKTPDKRHLLISPWRDHSLIGPNDIEYDGRPDEYRVTRTSIEDLLATTNACFRGLNLQYHDIKWYYGGLRPLTAGSATDTYKASRRSEICDHATDGLDGLITVIGGKYTTSLSLAEKVASVICDKLGRIYDTPACPNRLTYSCAGDPVYYIRGLLRQYPEFSDKTIERLYKHYGTECTRILELTRDNEKLGEMLNADGEILAQVVYAVRHEMALTLDDVLFRRTGIGTLGHPGNEVLEKISRTIAAESNWSPQRTDDEIDKAVRAFRLPE